MTAPRSPRIRENLPPPTSAEGEIFHYTPDEAAQWLPFSARKLRLMAFARAIEHVNNGNRVWFTGRQIGAISEQFTVDVLPEDKRPSGTEPHGRPRKTRTPAA